MRIVLRRLGYGLAFLLLLALLAALWVWIASWWATTHTAAPRPERLTEATPAQLADGERQAQILGCVSCHGEGLAGSKMFDEPGVATIWASNLTDVAARASDDQLAQAIRQGVGHDGRPLWVMPSALFARQSDAEVAALIAYVRSLPRRGEPTPETSLGLLGRVGIALGRFRSAPEHLEEFRARQPFDVGPGQAAGRRIAATVCADCHGPDLTGGSAGPDVTAPDLAVAAAYDLEQFRTLMRKGVPPGGRDLGLMGKVAAKDFSHFTDEEIGALHSYLKARAERQP